MVKIVGEMSSCWAARSGFFRNTVLESDSSGEQESPAAMGMQGNDKNTGKERHNIGLANGNCFLRGHLANISSMHRCVKSLNRHLQPP